MALPIDQLTKALTKEEVEQSIYNLLSASGLPITSWQSGSVVRTIIGVFAETFSVWTGIIAKLNKAEFLDLAEGIYLTLLAYYVYNVERIPPTFATGFVTLTNSGGGIYPQDPQDLIFVNPTTKKTYTNTGAFTLNGNTTLIIAIRATEEGKASSSTPNTITEMVTKLNGVSVTNALSVLGNDQESDANLRQRCKDALGALSPNGPQAAYEYFSKSTFRPDGSLIEVNRVKVSPDSSIGIVSVYLADSDGELDSGDVDLIDENIQANVVPIAITAIVNSAIVKNINIVATVYAKYTISLSTQSLTNDINNSLSDMFSTYPIGGYPFVSNGQGYLWKDKVEGAILNANDAIFRVDLTLEYGGFPLPDPGDFAMNTNDVITYSITPGDLIINLIV